MEKKITTTLTNGKQYTTYWHVITLKATDKSTGDSYLNWIGLHTQTHTHTQSESFKKMIYTLL